MRRIARHGWRQLSVLVALLLALTFIVKNLFVLQVLQAGNNQMQHHYSDEVASPQTEPPMRGTIVDNTGQQLVSTVTVFKLGAYPYLITNKTQAARAITNIIFPLQPPAGGNTRGIAAAYQKHYRQILGKLREPWTYVCLAGDDSDTCPLQNDISIQQANHVTKLKMAGFDLEPRNRPYYPNGPVAAHMLGFVRYAYPPGGGTAVDEGQYGLEQYYDNLLRGISGRVAVRQDTVGDAVRVGPGANSSGQQGAEIRLWLDSFLQYEIEHLLYGTIQATGAKSGTVVVERPSTGAVVAMASWPRYDPGTWKAILKADPQNGFSRFLNPAVNLRYTPGSTFKPILAAIGFDTNSFNTVTSVPDTGSLQSEGFKIQNWCLDSCDYNAGGGNYGTVQDMLHWSSNIAATQFSRRIPDLPFYNYLGRFGFGQLTGVDLPGEVPGDVRQPNDAPPKPVWVRAYKDTTAYGQGGISVTPLQMTNAYSVLANGGLLPTPHVAQSYALDGKTTTISTQMKGRVIGAGTAQEVTDILVRSAVGGEACRALVPGYDVAAKTGTTTISLNSNATISSTIAYGPTNFPVDQQLVVLMVLDEPANPYGSETAAPAVHDILRKLFNYYHLTPNYGNVTQPAKYCTGPLSPN